METTTTTSATSIIKSNGGGGSIIIKQQSRMKLENPFTLKVLQVFTGFGFGCGLGIGVGRPLNLGAIPVLSEVTRAASGATHAFSGVGRHVNQSLKKIGAKNIEAGIGCGVGFGHGFGIGIALKPGVMQKIQLFMMETMSKMMTKFGAAPDFSIGQGVLPASVQSGMNIAPVSAQDPLGSILQLGKKVPNVMNQDTLRNSKIHGGDGNLTSEDAPLSFSVGSRTEKLINGLLQDPVLRGVDTEIHARDDELKSENRVLRMVVKHQQIIEDLMEENERLRHILVEDLKVAPSKLVARRPSKNISPCTDCFECRRKQRRK
ncbi:uncharacterized protein LOC141638229 isoform X1 [Silene latifolia]|uniref:uncharacterized protein LOC141638229 isoform X1 n=1 Tax=Silene latifolia TaxID=37657 RepID=UPI003D772658